MKRNIFFLLLALSSYGTSLPCYADELTDSVTKAFENLQKVLASLSTNSEQNNQEKDQEIATLKQQLKELEKKGNGERVTAIEEANNKVFILQDIKNDAAGAINFIDDVLYDVESDDESTGESTDAEEEEADRREAEAEQARLETEKARLKAAQDRLEAEAKKKAEEARLETEKKAEAAEKALLEAEAKAEQEKSELLVRGQLTTLYDQSLDEVERTDFAHQLGKANTIESIEDVLKMHESNPRFSELINVLQSRVLPVKEMEANLQKAQADIVRLKAEAEAKEKAAARLEEEKKAEEARLKAEAAARLEAKKKAEAEAEQARQIDPKLEEDIKKLMKSEPQLVEDMKNMLESRFAEEEKAARRKAEAEAKKKAEEAARRKAEAEAKKLGDDFKKNLSSIIKKSYYRTEDEDKENLKKLEAIESKKKYADEQTQKNFDMHVKRITEYLEKEKAARLKAEQDRLEAVQAARLKAEANNTNTDTDTKTIKKKTEDLNIQTEDLKIYEVNQETAQQDATPQQTNQAI